MTIGDHYFDYRAPNLAGRCRWLVHRRCGSPGTAEALRSWEFGAEDLGPDEQSDW